MARDEAFGDLPDEAQDDGGRIELRPGGARRLGQLVGGVVALGGLAVLVVGPGDLGGDLGARLLFGLALLAGGGLTVIARGRRLAFDSTGVHEQGMMSSRSVAWTDVGGVELSEEWGSRGGMTRRLGPLTLNVGAGGGRVGTPGRAVGAGRHQRVLMVRIVNAQGRDLALSLDGADLEEGQALVARLRERMWLPEDVPVDVGR